MRSRPIKEEEGVRESERREKMKMGGKNDSDFISVR